MPGLNLPRYLFAGIVAAAVSACVIRMLAHLGGSSPEYNKPDEVADTPSADIPVYYAAAWQDRRTRFFVFKTVQFSLFALVLILAVVTPKNPHLPYWTVLSTFATWFIAYMVAGFWLNRFRCPRCGKLYYWRWEVKGSASRQKRWRDCHYCGLHQDQIPHQAERPIAGAGPVRG